MKLSSYLDVVSRLWWALLGAAVIGALSMYALDRRLPSVYEATASVRVHVPFASSANGYEDVLLNRQLLNTYVHLANSPLVLDDVALRLGSRRTAAQLAPLITVWPIRETELFAIIAQANSPDIAQSLANVVAEVFIQQQQRWAAGREARALSVVQPAPRPTHPIRPVVVLDTALAAVLALAVAHGLIFVLSYLSREQRV